MKTIGLIGGLTWQSTIEYYKLINTFVNKKLGAQHSAKILLSSVDFQPLYTAAVSDDWKTVEHAMSQEAKKLEKAGADLFLMCANTAHKVAEQVAAQVSIPFVHIIEATAQKIKNQKLNKVALLGTRPTMSDGFYQSYMAKHQIEVLSPNAADRETIHKIIFEEIVYGKILESSRQKYLAIIGQLTQEGAQGVIAGCSEIPLLIQQQHVGLPYFDTTHIHAEAAVNMAFR